MCAVRQTMIRCSHNSLDFITASPLDIARVSIYSPNVLAHFWLNGLQQKVIDRIERVGKNEFRPGKYPQLITYGVEIIYATGDRRTGRLISTTAPDSELSRK